MASSVAEKILVLVKEALLAGPTTAGPNVFRGRPDPLSAEEMPGINVVRRPTTNDVLGNTGGKVMLTFDLDLNVVGDDWETGVDALHMEADAALQKYAALQAMGRGLRCTGTECQGESADFIYGRMTAHYQIQVFVRPGDLTRPVN